MCICCYSISIPVQYLNFHVIFYFSVLKLTRNKTYHSLACNYFISRRWFNFLAIERHSHIYHNQNNFPNHFNLCPLLEQPFFYHLRFGYNFLNSLLFPVAKPWLSYIDYLKVPFFFSLSLLYLYSQELSFFLEKVFCCVLFFPYFYQDET